MKRCLVLGAGGLIGSNLVHRLKADGHFVRAISRHSPSATLPDESLKMDLRRLQSNDPIFAGIDEVFQLAAEAGGIAYETDPSHDAARLRDSAQINLNVLEACRFQKVPKVFFPSSGAVYSSSEWLASSEDDAPPFNPDSEYAYEKIFSERLYVAYARNYGLQVRIARIHSTYGTPSIVDGLRARAPAALCAKVARLPLEGGVVDVWGDGAQTRSFAWVGDTVEGIVRFMASDFQGPLNLGSSEMVTIDDLVHTIARIAGKKVTIKHIDGPVGVRGRSSDNTLCREKLNWEPSTPLIQGLQELYSWVDRQVKVV